MTSWDTHIALQQAVEDSHRESDQDATPDHPPIVYDADAVLRYHRRKGQDCSCGDWPVGADHTEHQALALHAAGLLGYQPMKER